MSQKKWVSGLLLMLLALIFSIGLTFASVELPGLLNKTLYGTVPDLDGDSHADESAVTRTELFISHYHLRLIGYICFGVMVLLIAAGFITGKKNEKTVEFLYLVGFLVFSLQVIGSILPSETARFRNCEFVNFIDNKAFYIYKYSNGCPKVSLLQSNH